LFKANLSFYVQLEIFVLQDGVARLRRVTL